MKNITFYTHPWSRGRVTRWMLEECGANYTTKVVEYGSSMKSAPYTDINPMGKVPALQYGSQIITENVAICTFLADQFPEKRLAPEVNNSLRGEYYRWLFFTAGPLEAAVTAKELGTLPDSEHHKMVGYGDFDILIKTLEKAVSNKDFICGDHFTAADLYMSACINWFMEFENIPKLPAFEDYAGKHINREAALKARKIDDELLKKHPL